MEPEELLAAIDERLAAGKQMLSDLRSQEKTMRAVHKEFRDVTLKTVVKDFEDRLSAEVESGLRDLHQALHAHKMYVDREMRKTAEVFERAMGFHNRLGSE